VFEDAILRRGTLLYLLFEVRGPGMLYQHPKYERCRHRKAGMIKKSYGNKAEDERAGRAPEPYVLVQNEEGGYSNDETRERNMCSR
jgi:hypothetical protein